MARFRKKILMREGDYHSPDGVLSANRDSIAKWAQKFNELKAKRFDIPVGWGHADDLDAAKPIKRRGERRRLPKDNAGWLTDFRALEDGGAEIEIDVPRADDAEKVRANLAEVSPVIWDEATIGTGETHTDFIGAVDLVLHPVDHEQSKFEESAIACSLTRRGKVYRLAEDDMADDDYKADDNGNGEDNGEEAVENSPERMRKVLDALAAIDIVLPEDTTGENLLERLESALLTAAAKDGAEVGDNGGGAEEMAPDESAPEVAALSLERQYLNRQHRSKVESDIAGLVDKGQCTPHEAKQKRQLVGAVKLNLDKAGNHRLTGLEEWIESRKAVPEGTFFDAKKRENMKRFSTEAQPEWSRGNEVDDKEADEIVGSILGRRS